MMHYYVEREGGASGVQPNDSLVDGYDTLLLIRAASTNATALLNTESNAASRPSGLAYVHAKF